MREGPPTPVLIDERLADGAPLQHALAAEHCRDSCGWYHGPRLFLRALGVMRGVQTDTAFLLDAIRQRANDGGGNRVLISGAADWGLLAHVASAWTARDPDDVLEITVVDRCATPLAMNAWYGRSIGVAIQTAQSDILEYRADRPFDLICTHSFLSNVNEADRPSVAARWHGLLRPGGAVITVQGLYPTDQGLSQSATTRAAGYRRRAGQLRDEACRRLGVERRTVQDWVETYIERKRHRPVRSLADFRGLFERHGFRVVRLVANPADGAGRARLVAERLP